MNRQNNVKSQSKVAADLQSRIEELYYERAFLRQIIMRNSDSHQKPQSNPSTLSEEEINESLQTTEELQGSIKQLSLERDFLIKELYSLTEENEDINATLDKIIEEKDATRIQIAKEKEELETCKQLVDFLVLERDNMKKEIETKDKLLACYNHLFNKDNMFKFMKEKKKKPARS